MTAMSRASKPRCAAGWPGRPFGGRWVSSLGLSLALVGLALGAARPAWSFDLTRALQGAREHDAQYRAAQYDLQASQEARVQGRAGLLPDVSVVGSAYRNNLRREYPNADGEAVRTKHVYDSNSLTLQVRQPLYNRDAQALARRGDAQSRLGEHMFAARSDELVLRLVEAYSKVLLAQEHLRLSEAQVLAMQEEAQASERLFARGEGTRTDVLESASGLELARALRIEAASAHADALALLRAVVGPGVALDTIRRLETGAHDFEPLAPERLEDWEQLALQANAQIAASRVAVEIAREDLARADAGHHPRLDLVATAGQSHSDSVNTLGQKYEQSAIGIQLQVPLYAGGRVSSMQRQSIAFVAKAEAELDNVQSQTRLQLQTQFTALYSGARRIVALQKALEAGTQQIEATRKSVAGGVRIRLDVLRAQQQASQTARDLAKARFDHALAWLRLRSLAGQLHEDNLAEVQRKLEQGLLPTPPQALVGGG